jgi:hypothetical protein
MKCEAKGEQQRQEEFRIDAAPAGTHVRESGRDPRRERDQRGQTGKFQEIAAGQVR